MSLSYIGQQITIYGGLFLLVTGIVGNGINIFIFSTVVNYRKTPCTFYFIVASIANIVYILFNFTTRIIGAIYGTDFISISRIWCKIRQFLLVAVSLITLTCSCLAMIDQFLTTSRSVHIRRYSNIKWARRIVLIIIIVWCLHAIPCLFYFDISPTTNKCGSVNAVYAIYSRVYLLGLLCIIPILVMGVFGCLTYRNIHQTRVLLEQQADRQLVRMTLFQVILVIISLLPYGINSAYNLITEKVVKDANQLLKENFATTVVTIVTYCDYAGSCYMFFISSSRFRQATKNRLFLCSRPNQVIPAKPPIIGTETLNKRTQR